MTKDEILGIPAGEDIDAMVHRVVFGNEVDKIVLVEDPSKYYYSSKTEIKHYSTDIAAAWEVVTKIKHRFHVSVSEDSELERIGGASYKSVVWILEPTKDDEYEVKAHVYADTSPLAICRAALFAIMEA